MSRNFWRDLGRALAGNWGDPPPRRPAPPLGTPCPHGMTEADGDVIVETRPEGVRIRVVERPNARVLADLMMSPRSGRRMALAILDAYPGGCGEGEP